MAPNSSKFFNLKGLICGAHLFPPVNIFFIQNGNNFRRSAPPLPLNNFSDRRSKFITQICLPLHGQLDPPLTYMKNQISADICCYSILVPIPNRWAHRRRNRGQGAMPPTFRPIFLLKSPFLLQRQNQRRQRIHRPERSPKIKIKF